MKAFSLCDAMWCYWRAKNWASFKTVKNNIKRRWENVKYFLLRNKGGGGTGKSSCARQNAGSCLYLQASLQRPVLNFMIIFSKVRFCSYHGQQLLFCIPGCSRLAGVFECVCESVIWSTEVWWTARVLVPGQGCAVSTGRLSDFAQC